jgi:tripartite-type tricarboxylate transporter receptor subunit TctC
VNAPLPRALELVIGFSPGSMSDDIAKILVDALRDECGIALRVTRQTGDNGIAAARAVAACAPDGMTLFMATLGTHAIAPLLNVPAPYDPLRDFAPVSLLTQSPMLLACHPSLGARSVAELIARAQRDALTYATSATGGAPHLAAVLFESITGTAMRHVRYEQTEQLYRDLEAGKVALSFNNIASMLPRCKRGALTALAVSTAARSAAAPELPTLAEAGVSGYEMSNWTGIVAPPATPRDAAAALSDVFAAALRAPRTSALLAEQGITPRGTSPQELTDFMHAERERWRGVVARIAAAAH